MVISLPLRWLRSPIRPWALRTSGQLTFVKGFTHKFPPAIGALKAFGASVNPQDAPYLYEILNNRSETLVVMVGAGVGLAAVIANLHDVIIILGFFLLLY